MSHPQPSPRRPRWIWIVWLIGGLIALPFVLLAARIAWGFFAYLLLGHP